jgi:hypothetical protein
MGHPTKERTYIERDPEILNPANANLSQLQHVGNTRCNLSDHDRLLAAMALEIGVADRYDGNSSWFAREVGVSHSLVRRWRMTGLIPAWRVMDVVELMNHSLVTPEILRPDVFRARTDAGPMQHYDGRGQKKSILNPV